MDFDFKFGYYLGIWWRDYDCNEKLSTSIKNNWTGGNRVGVTTSCSSTFQILRIFVKFSRLFMCII